MVYQRDLRAEFISR